ncbi:retrovirus-related pol polyprotein from transposon TNT 1-94 [Tanacetum coccineum]
MAKASPTQAWLWHRRLSHLNFDYINLLLKKDVVIGLPKLKYVKDQLCSSCEVSKAKKKFIQDKGCSKFERTAKFASYGLMWSNADETLEVLKDFLTMIQRNLQALVISVRTDRGTEFLNKTLNAFFKEERIKHQTSTPRTPEQNGIVERQNRTLLEAARTMLSASKLPLYIRSISSITTGEFDLLIVSYCHDEFFNTVLSRVNKSSSPIDNSARQDTQPSMNIHPPTEPSTPTNDHAKENNINQAEDAQFQQDEFTNPSVHRPVQKQGRPTATNHEMCMFTLTVSTAEPKNIKEAMADSAWIEAMHEELHQFDKLQVWEFVDKPFGKNEEGIDFEESFAPVARLELSDFCRISCHTEEVWIVRAVRKRVARLEGKAASDSTSCESTSVWDETERSAVQYSSSEQQTRSSRHMTALYVTCSSRHYTLLLQGTNDGVAASFQKSLIHYHMLKLKQQRHTISIKIQDSRKLKNLKTKTFAYFDIKDNSSETKFRARLLKSSQEDAKYEDVGQDTRLQGGKNNQD